MKCLVAYYSKTGNNKYLAERLAQALKCDIEAIKPRMNLFPILMLFTLTKVSLGVRAIKNKVTDYDHIIVCGPIWMGRLISPLRDFLIKFNKNNNKLFFVTCCGSSDAAKEGKFGYARVFQVIKKVFGERCVHCEAFPISLVLNKNKKEDVSPMKTRLSDTNFTGEIQKRFEEFIKKVVK